MRNGRIFLDEDVLRIQNEVRRYKNEQRIHDGDVNDKMQRGDISDTDPDTLPDKSRGNFVQDTFTVAERK